MKTFGLLGYPLGHSFSKKYFGEKFAKEGIKDCEYNNFELENAEDLLEVIRDLGSDFKGCNVTIPHKQNVMPLLAELDPKAERIGAVNVIKPIGGGKLKGYNSDYYGFRNSLEQFLDGQSALKALILGTGGASKAVKVALEDLGIDHKYVSRTAFDGGFTYDDLTPDIIAEHQLIINCTPLGTYPKIEDKPALPYEGLSKNHFLYDLVYNPEVTAFMQEGLDRGSKAKNGYDMLVLQAEKAWEIWNA